MRRRAFHRHVDHEMSQALKLGRDFAAGVQLPAHVVQAMRVAYATHFRALMEFFHAGRPARMSHPRDLTVSLYLPAPARPFPWTTREKSRFAAADKLAGHLSMDRIRRHHARREWGDPEDDRLLRLRVRQFFAAQPLAAKWFPETARVLHE
jgi:hypothetical protein